MAVKRIDLEIRTGIKRSGKCGIFGAGKYGATIAYGLLQSRLFSDLVLSDPSPTRVSDTVSALSGALPFLSTSLDVYTGNISDLSDCEIVIFALEQDIPRAMLTDLMSDAAATITRDGYAPILINASPAHQDLTQLLLTASKLPSGRVFGIGGVAEALRLQKMVARHLGTDCSAVHVFLVGKSPSTCFPLWRHANVAGIDLEHFCEMCGRGYDVGILDGLFQSIHKERAVTDSRFAVAEALRMLCTSITRDENALFSLACTANGQYGLENIELVLPCAVGRSGIRRILELPLEYSEERTLSALFEK